MYRVKFLILFTACFAPFIGSADEHIFNDKSSNLQVCDEVDSPYWKIYVRTSQILISDEGIYVVDDGEYIPIPQLNYDENGLYYIARKPDTITDKCTNGHKI